MKFLKYYQKYSLFLFAVIALIAYGGIVVSAIAPGETLDPVGDALCAGPTDPVCAINPYENLDPNSILYLNDDGNLTTDELFLRNDDIFFVGTATLNPGYLTGISIDDVLENGFFIGSSMVHLKESADSFNLVFNGDASGVGLSDQTTLVGYLDFNNNYQSIATFEPDAIDILLRVQDSFGDDIVNVMSMADDVFEFISHNDSVGDQSKIMLTHSSGITFEFDGSSGYTFPRTNGDVGEVLTTDGAGVLSWESVGGGLTIGDTVTDGTLDRILFIDSSGNLADSTSDNMRIEIEAEDDITVYVSSDSGGRFRIRDDISGNGGLSVEPGVNGTLLEINDSSEEIVLSAGSSLLFQDSGGYEWFKISPEAGNQYVRFGDMDSIFNGTTFALDDNSQTISGATMSGGSGSNLYVNSIQNYLTWTDGVDTWGFGSDEGSFGRTVIYGGDTVYTWPSSNGSNGDVLTLGTSGALSWESTTSLTGLTENNNTFLGVDAGLNNSGGTSNTFIGYQSGLSNTTGYGNTTNGMHSLRSNTIGYENTAAGLNSLYSNTFGAVNVANGSNSLYSNTTGMGNVAMGFASGYANTTGSYNVFSGFGAGRYQFEQDNQIAIGYEALAGSSTPANNTGTNNIAIGYQAGFSNITGIRNLAIGTFSLYSNTTGVDNVALGYESLRNNTIGQQNVAIGGYRSLYLNTEGNGNISLGYNLIANTTGSANIALGIQALNSVETGFGSISIGQGSLFSATGSTNIAIGYGAADNLTTGSNNIVIGYNIDAPLATGDNQLNIGGAILGDLSTGNISISSLISCGGIQTNGSGTMSCTSDQTLKDIQGDFTKGLGAIRGINPAAFSWKANSSLYDGGVIYNGFIAQNVQDNLPEAISISSGGKLQVSQLTLTASLINAVKELDISLLGVQQLSDETFLNRIRTWFADAGNGIGELFVRILRSDRIHTNELCIEDICVTKDQLQQLLQNQNISTVYYNSSSHDTDDVNNSNEQDNESEIIDENTENTSDESDTETENIGNATDESNVNEEPQEDIVEESEESEETAEESSNEDSSEDSSGSESNDSDEAPAGE